MTQASPASPASSRDASRPEGTGDTWSTGTGSEARSPDDRPLHDRRMLEALVCPLTHATLSYDADRQELVSRAAGLAFPIRAGIPIMLVDEARQIKADD